MATTRNSPGTSRRLLARFEAMFAGWSRRQRVAALAVVTLVAMLPTTIGIAGSTLRPGHGLITVDVQPVLPAEIRIDDVPRNVGGVQGLELPVGDHEVCFSDVAGYLTPACQIVSIVEGGDHALTGTYAPAGQLSVTVEPDDVSAIVIVDGVERDVNTTTVPVLPGTHEVCWSTIEGFLTPPCQKVEVLAGQITDVVGHYEVVEDPTPEPETTPEPEATPEPEPDPLPSAPNLLGPTAQTFDGADHGWTPQGNTVITTATTPAYDSVGSLLVSVDAAGPYPDSTRTARVGTAQRSDGIPITVGQSYSGQVRVHSPAGPVTARCEVRWFDSIGKGRIIDTVPGELVTVAEGRWSTLQCAATAPERATTASLRVYFDDVDYGREFLIDDAWFVAGTLQSSTEPAADPTPEPTSEPSPDPTSSPSPDPTSSPTQEPTPDSQPASGNWPGPDTTGPQPGVSLVPSGSITTSADGQVIENVEVTGAITVEHSNVTIRNARVLSTGRYGISVPHTLNDSVKGLLIEDVEIVGVSGERSAGLVHYGEWTARRVEVRGFQDGVKVRSNQVLESSWIHDFHTTSTSHNDAIQSVGGSNVVIRHNSIEGPWSAQTSALIIQSDLEPVSDYVIHANRLSGGNYTVYLRDKGNGHGPPSNVTVTDNVWVSGSWQYGTLSMDAGPGLTWSGNVYDDGSPYNR